MQQNKKNPKGMNTFIRHCMPNVLALTDWTGGITAEVLERV
jgi:hypothetical protein